MLVEVVSHKILPETSFVVVQTRINYGSVDVYELVGGFIFVKYNFATLPFLSQVLT
jgi:hypothetical protein